MNIDEKQAFHNTLNIAKTVRPCAQIAILQSQKRVVTKANENSALNDSLPPPSSFLFSVSLPPSQFRCCGGGRLFFASQKGMWRGLGEKREKSHFCIKKREWGEGNSARALPPRPHINATTYKFDMRLASHFFILLGGRCRYVKGIALIVLEISDL